MAVIRVQHYFDTAKDLQMPDFIVLRLTPSTPVDPGAFTNYLAGLTVKVYDISSAHPRAGLPGDPTPPIGTAVYHNPTKNVPLPIISGGPFVTYPAGTRIAQHYSLVTLGPLVVDINFESVATVVIPYAPPAAEYVAPDLRVEFDRGGASPLRDSNVFYDVQILTAGGAPDPSTYQDIPPAQVGAYLTLRAPLTPGTGQLGLPSDGTPPNYDDLLAAVTAVLAKDPGGAPTQAQIAALTVEQCKNIAFEIIYGPQPALPTPPEALGSMYTNPPNDGSNTNTNEQSRQDFQGKLNSYYSTNNATAQRLTNFVYSLSTAVWCELQTQTASQAIVTFPVNPNPSSPPKLPTVAETQVVFTGALGADVPAEYFYALTAQLPTQITPDQRYKIATTGEQKQILAQLTDALDAGMIVMPPSAPQPAVNPAQAARLLTALAVPLAASAVQCPVAGIQPLWSDWRAFPRTSPPADNWRSYKPGDDITAFWPAEEAAQQGHFLDLVLFVLTQGYVDPATAVLLATEIKANLLFTPPIPPPSHIHKVADLAGAAPGDWRDFFAPLPGHIVQANLLPPFTLPGTPEARVTAFIHYVQKFFDMPAPPPAIGPPGVDAPSSLHLPVFDLIQQCIFAFGGLVFGVPLTAVDLTNLAAAAAVVIPGDPEAQAWLVQTIRTINELAILANLPGQPDSFRFSVMEALYARGFTSLESVLDIPEPDFQQALTGTVAYDSATKIYANAGVAGGFPPPGAGGFTPINPDGLLVDCIPPLYLSPFGPVEYLAEMLRVSEASTCDAPFTPPAPGHTTLKAAIEARRGPLGSLAVSRANLETPLPLIDIVNECLEFVASTASPSPHGVVYDTSGDALAGHKLCSDECCCGGKGCAECGAKKHADVDDENKVDLHACHKPATLYEALPEYSTPATPVAANAAVLPAVYNSLKTDFSSCCLPYSQALDVSRTYLRHFKSCRFEEMRVFRKCITEFVLDPVHEPAGFQDHLWRYPVRIDIAMEYLGITPEEYAILFKGAPAGPCGSTSLPSPPTDTRPGIPVSVTDGADGGNRLAAGRDLLSDFLAWTCLTYCEFLELWKTGFVPFSNGADREGGKFPDCEPCCLEDYWLQFPGEEGRPAAIYKLLIFIRLWRKLKEPCCEGYTFTELQDICLVLQLFIGNSLNPEFIRQLAAFQMLRDHFRLPLAERRATVPANATGAERSHLLALWAGSAATKWEWAVDELIERIKFYAECHHRCRPRSADFLKLLTANLDPLSRLAGFDPAVPSNTWHVLPTHTLRFAEVLAKIYASKFEIGEILFIFTAQEHLDGDDPFPMQEANEALDIPLDLPEDDREHGLWRLRHKLLQAEVEGEQVHHWTWHRIESALQHEFGYDSAEIILFGEHFFPHTLEHAGYAVTQDQRRFVRPLNAADTNPLTWNTPHHGPFRYDAGAQQLWTQLPVSDEEVIEQLTHVRGLQSKERAAVQDLYFQPRAMLARFALLFEDFAVAEARLVQGREEKDRWEFFRHEFARFHKRCRIIAEHLAEHVEAATGQEHPEGVNAALLILRSLYADENENQPGTDWESDAGHAPPVKWSPAPNGGAFAALLGLTGTGLMAEFTPTDGAGAAVWREPCDTVAGFGRAKDTGNCPVPTVLPALDLKVTPAQEQFVSAHNGLAMKHSTGVWLGGAQGFRVEWSGALLIDLAGTYEFFAGAPGSKDTEDEEPGRRRWRVTVKKGQKTWIVASHNWPEEPNLRSGSVRLQQGAYQLIIELVQPTPLFNEEGDIFPLRTGLRLDYSGPDTEDKRSEIPHKRLLLIGKDQPLGDGLNDLSDGAAAFLNQYYVSSLRDIRRTYQRAFKALLFVHRFALSAHSESGGRSELGYMLTQKDKFAGASYYDPGPGYQKHLADFDFNLLPLRDDYSPPAGDSRTAPSLKRIQALFDWWERIFDYVRARSEVRSHCDRRLWLLFAEAADKLPADPGYLLRHMCADSRHWRLDLSYFQNQASPVYQVTSVDLKDDRWVVRAWRADQWIRAMLRAFDAKDITLARPDLWASDDPSALVPGETVTGNANLSQLLCDGCFESGAPRRYEDVKRLNNGLRERGRRALLCYLCRPGAIAKTPKELSELLLLDVETGLCEKASRFDEAISAVQTFIQRARLNLEPGWTVSKDFALLWDRQFRTYHIWEKCKRRERYKENWIEWCELEKAKKIEAFRFLDEQLRRVTLTIATPGGVDYWPDQRPAAHPGLTLLRRRDAATMQLLDKPREGLDLLGSPERAGRPSWLTQVPGPTAGAGPSPPTGTVAPVRTVPSPAAGGPAGPPAPQPDSLPYWMEAAIELGTRFIRIAAAGYPPASTGFNPRKEHHKDGQDKSCCVDCCEECGREHPRRLDEYYFWLVDGRHFAPLTQDEHYDQNQQVSPPWHNCGQLTTLLSWPSDPMVRLAWCRVHNGEFQQPRRSDFGIAFTAGGAPPDLNFRGRVGDSLYFEVTVPATVLAPDPGFRYDLATDTAPRLYDLALPAVPPVPYPGGLIAYPYFGYFHPGARLFPWSIYTPAVAVAHALRAHCRFEAALKWYALAYDPLQQDDTWMRCQPETTSPPPTGGAPSPGVPPPPTVSTTVPPTGVTVVTGQGDGPTTACCDSTDVSCLVARQRSILLHYLDTLLEWGDALMRRNSPEAFQQARLIFDTMARIMGKHPRSIWNTPPPIAQTVENFVPLFPPLNPRLMMLYDRLDDRLAAIHACINARRLRNGRECAVPYFGNDPFRDGWRSNCEVCPDEADWCLPHSPYRFLFLAQKARELTARVRELGNALLAAFEKGDSEYLAALRARHEHQLAALALKARQDQWREADWQVQALGKTKENRQNDRRYYAQLIQNGLINHETQYLAQVDTSQGDRAASIVSEAIAEAMDIIPDLFVGFPCEETWIPVGTKLAGMFKTIARISSILAEIASAEGSRDLSEAGWDRRLQDWVHRVELLDIEIEQIELQALGAERRRSQTLRELNIQQATIENAEEAQNFMRDKLSSHAVYLCLQKETAELYYRTYELALYAARQAERAFNFERGHTARRFLPEDPWDNLREGLLAGDRLDAALSHMEKEYLDLNAREEELTKHISLRINFPMEFLKLKVTGRCEIRIPEWMFDHDYPGHYMRRIKNVALTIPCVTGPYTGVHCRLTLLSSSTRINPMLRTPAAHCCGECKYENPYEACPHDPRVIRHYGAREAIATSSGRNDAGMFELNFRDDRYLPFEYQGAVSCWRFELPAENNFFDMNSLTDVVMHLNYTAREGGDILRAAANRVAERWLPGACWSFFDIRHDFPDAWEQFRTACESERPRDLILRINRNMFPFVPGSPEIRIDTVALLFETPERREGPCAVPECPCPEERVCDSHTVDLTTSRVGRDGCHELEEEDMLCVASEDWPELYYGVLATRLGPLASREGRHHEAKFRFHPEVGEVSRAYLFCKYSMECTTRPDCHNSAGRPSER
jgi:Tc toxin complex TcA C-terminal TcB-binding domain